jgi:two-component system OmpR family response regulator
METTPQPKTILVVDDERHIVRKTVEALQAARFATAQAYDGVEAIEWLDANPPPDVILLDIMMPRLDGIEVFRWLRARERFAATYTIFLTARGSFGNDKQRLDSLLEMPGVDTCLWKPYSAEDAVAIVERRLAGITGTLPWGYQPKPPSEPRNFVKSLWVRLMDRDQ